MSLVVAIKDKDRFILGADKQASVWNSKTHNATKIWPTEYEGCCMGSVGYARASQIIQFIKGLLDGVGFGKPELDDAFIHLQLPRTIYETLKMHGAIPEAPEGSQFILPNDFFIAYKDRCWKINQDLSVEEVEEYDAIGSGSEVALGVIETSYMYKEKNPYQIITNAIDIAAEKTLYVDHEVEFAETVPDKKDIVNRMLALGYDVPDSIKKAKNPMEAYAKFVLGLHKPEKQEKPENSSEAEVNEPKESKDIEKSDEEPKDQADNKIDKKSDKKTKKKQRLLEDKE